ncbi:MAG: hypothetical protein LBH26_03605 [Treponema sp.]|jgi:hypothetical protein|nr:hypothetical protein [Treponema sp.]
MLRGLPLLLALILLPPLCLSAQPFPPAGTGVSAAAGEAYLALAEDLINEGRWSEALAVLERGGEFSDVSSDISYLLARARYHENLPRSAVLEALRRAFAAGRWAKYSPAAARLLEAEMLIGLRSFSEALRSLSLAPPGAEEARLRLLALLGLPDLPEFRRIMAETINRYPRDPRPVEILFSYARDRFPRENEPELIALALRRLPYLLEEEPRLGYLAAPFVGDTAEARRLVEAYRAGGKPEAASIPVSLNLGIIDETLAAEELFGPSPGSAGERAIGKELILSVWALLRNREGRDLFKRNLLAFSGVITEDADGDGFPEARTRYREGLILEYSRDADQDGRYEFTVAFSSGGSPAWAEQALAGEEAGAYILWERYPGVLRVEFEGLSYIPRPQEFLYTPIRFSELSGGGGEPGLLYPEAEMPPIRLTRRSLVSYALRIERPSTEFEGALEIIDLDRGIPWRATELLGGRPVALTEFEGGRPRFQRLDLDLDSRMETLRHFRDGNAGDPENPLAYERVIELSESDWNGDGIFETAEQYFPDGRIIYSWDIDGDGIRDYSETRERKE